VRADIGCKPLEPEKTYRIGATAGGVSGGGLFRLDKRGVPILVLDTCTAESR
jgi:hypothetical protein